MSTTIAAIQQYIEQHNGVSVKELVDTMDLYPTIIHRHLKKLLDQGFIKKIGSAPRVLYVANNNPEHQSIELDYQDIQFLENNYYTYDSDGQILKGIDGFVARCAQRKFDYQQQFVLYKAMLESINKLKDNHGLIDGTKYLSPNLGKHYIHTLHYVDAYQIGHFGKSKLGSITFYAKQSQNKELIKKVIQIIKYPILSYIQDNQIDAVCFAPPSITRPVQLMTEIRKGLAINLPEIKLIKLFPNGVIIPQKSLKSMEQRIKNATNTIFLARSNTKAKRVLIIDDFMGSGATINIIAKNIIEADLAEKVEAISLLGNIDTKYEVINEI